MLSQIFLSIISVVFQGENGIPPETNRPKTAVSVPVAKNAPSVPFYSQFRDIEAPEWKKLGCGIASLAMIINYHEPDTVTVDGLLSEGIRSGAYIEGAGWSHRGLANVSENHGFKGTPYDFSSLSEAEAFSRFLKLLDRGPVIASVHYKMEPDNPIPHLVVINGMIGGTLYYNDPAEKNGQKKISAAGFLAAWKKRFIAFTPSDIASE